MQNYSCYECYFENTSTEHFLKNRTSIQNIQYIDEESVVQDVINVALYLLTVC